MLIAHVFFSPAVAMLPNAPSTSRRYCRLRLHAIGRLVTFALVVNAVGAIALFEFESTPAGVKIATEERCRLVAPDELTPEVLKGYWKRLPSTSA